MTEAITFQALFGKAQTTPDGGWAITLNVAHDSAHAVMQAAQLRDCIIQVALVPTDGENPLSVPQIEVGANESGDFMDEVLGI